MIKYLLQFLFPLYSGLLLVMAGFMLLSFPLGAYTVFNTEIGGEITYQHPLNYEFMQIILSFEIGEVFILLWCIYLSLFSILLFKDRNILTALLSSIREYSHPTYNKLAMVIVWFSILLIGSKIIDFIQQQFGIQIGEVKEDNLLLKFFNLSNAPLIEEPIFRVLLIGLPSYLLSNKRFNIIEFIKTLWQPEIHLRHRNNIIIILSAVIFGLLHVLSGWDYGKMTQATFAGIILGFIYYRYGLHASIILHWCTNYFLPAYGLFTASVFAFTWNDIAKNPLLTWLDILLTVIGVISLSIYAARIIKFNINKISQ